MKYLKVLALLCGGLFVNLSYADDPEWDDIMIESVQLKKPIDYLSNDKLNYYSYYSDDLKVKIVDYGILNRSTGKEKYQLQEYGVEILNKNKIYQLFKTRGSYNNQFWVRINNIWLNEEAGYLALTVRTNDYVNYGSLPERTNDVTTYIYNLKNNKFMRLNSISVSSNVDSKGDAIKPLDCTVGVKLSYNEKTKLFTYTDLIQKGCDGPINAQTIKNMPVYKVTFDRNFKCISTNKLAGGCSDEDNINESIGNYTAEFLRMKKK
ncbi:hypothetical protein [Acinetobacter pollinis]|uniref:hypothetical protein n=1 Tax=Acinetobacter pollinis TaxID=2605270 RepID=UPI0018A31AEA|nr:hypothetical protein [Acinetobacter pollinis]MBF7691529.1 hypothetical protein [Acinetobacter pollinis]MBF7699214.1 hypothetical protein [Acinetobacter pollinis]